MKTCLGRTGGQRLGSTLSWHQGYNRCHDLGEGEGNRETSWGRGEGRGESRLPRDLLESEAVGNPIPTVSCKVLGLLGNSKLLNDCLKTGICLSIDASVSTLIAVFTLRGRSSYGHAGTHKTRSESSFGLTSRLFPVLWGLSSGDGEES